MSKTDQETVNDAFLSDEQYRQALRNFANAAHESLQDEGEEGLQKSSIEIE